jgi:hypothetical protein
MRIRRRVLIFAALALMAAQPLFSQTESKSDAGSKGDSQQSKHHYRLDFVLKETADGNVINQRSFSLGIGASPVRDADRASLRAGTRIPLSLGEKEVQWVDIGTDIDVYNAVENPEGLQMEVNAEISSPAAEPASGNGATAFRQVKARCLVLARLGKSAQVFTADDPASKHRFELDVKAVQSE